MSEYERKQVAEAALILQRVMPDLNRMGKELVGVQSLASQMREIYVNPYADLIRTIQFGMPKITVPVVAWPKI